MPYMINCRDMSVIGQDTTIKSFVDTATLTSLRIVRDDCLALAELCNHMLDEQGKSDAITSAFEAHVQSIRSCGEYIGD